MDGKEIGLRLVALVCSCLRPVFDFVLSYLVWFVVYSGFVFERSEF